MELNQEEIHYYFYNFPLSLKSEDAQVFNYWAYQVFSTMENAMRKHITNGINIFISSSFNSPESWPNERPIRINLSMNSLSYWAQEVYQLAHECCHVLINSPYSPQVQDEWFEEVICECASRFALVKMNGNGLAKKISPNSFLQYEKRLFKEKIYKFNPSSFSDESSETLLKMRTHHEWREPQKHLANMLYPLIAENDDFWQSVPGLVYFKDQNTFLENLNTWYEESPKAAKPQVAKIIKLFSDN